MTLYKKVGKKYVPVTDTEAYSGLDNGHWLISIEKGSTSCRRAINPAFAELELACLLTSHKIVGYLSEVSAGRPKSQPLTEKEQKGLKAFYEIAGKDCLLYWEYPSLQEMAEKIVKLIASNGKCV